MLLLCLLPTLWMTRLQQQRLQAEQDEAFGKIIERSHAALLSQLDTCDLLVRSVQTLFLTSDMVTETELDHLYANLQPRRHLPSLQALAYSELEAGGDGDRFITTWVVPREGNQRLIGLDISTQPANLRAAELSRDTDEAVMSAPFRLAQLDHTGESAEGVTLRLPIYTAGAPPVDIRERRRRIVGSLAVSLQVSSLIEWALPADARDGLHVMVRDVTGAAPAMLYDSHPQLSFPAPEETVAGHTRDGRAVRSVDVVHGGRAWRMRVAQLTPPRAVSAWRDTVLIPGIVISLLLSLLVGSLASTRRRALDLGWQLSQRHRESEERFRALTELLPALVVLSDANSGRIHYANQAARDRLGGNVGERTLQDLIEDHELRARLSMPDSSGCQGVEAQLRTGEKRSFWASVSITLVELDGRRMWLMVANDISEQRQLTELLSYQASHDTLTELFNRREFERRLDRVRAEVASGGPVGALFYIDLDQFKLINDTSGHIAGDQLLAQLAMVMREQLRGEDVLARLGGDEFGVLVSDVHNRAGAEEVGERLRRHIDGYVFVWEQRSFTITASIGVVMIEHADTSLDDLLTQADTACYIAKESGRNRVHFYSAMDDDATRRQSEMEWANRLRWAVDEHLLLLKYQEVWPLAAPRDGGPRIEVLLRFRGDNGRQVVPGAFLPAAERYGLMPMIDRWVIETVIANFDRLHPSGTGLKMATINLSGASIEDNALADHILALIDRHRVDPSRICFEITETVAVRNLSHVVRLIERLRAIGCSFALDDFGAGMSSFGYLKNLPVDIIKIDGSFIRDMLIDPMSEAIVRAVCDIGHQRGLKVVAEWVNDPQVAEALVELGVDYGQGFALHEPEYVTFHGDAA
ncbi:bifunctional diguanylate cyclase/phosphodiesterase [Marilutibacter maris]|uniref:Diguanylate cyclase n=1 Tax=Marilutibacter maris TaxID=1605891 RepID=A0A2U9TFL3_9GAMM|nr:EAL domain-containing protein [Lysobacter maris]AWV08409.1 diguanylate cyclase [Lysobacter maris]